MPEALDLAPLVSGKRFLITGASGFIGGRLKGSRFFVLVGHRPLHVVAADVGSPESTLMKMVAQLADFIARSRRGFSVVG